MSVVLHTHAFSATPAEVATTSPPFYNEPHRLHILFVKVSYSMTFTSWSQHHFLAIRKPKWHVCEAFHCGSKQQQSSPDKITLLLLVHATYMGVVLHAHSVHGEPRIQHNASRAVATIDSFKAMIVGIGEYFHQSTSHSKSAF